MEILVERQREGRLRRRLSARDMTKRHRDIDKHEKAEIEETMRQIAKRNEIERGWKGGERETYR